MRVKTRGSQTSRIARARISLQVRVESMRRKAGQEIRRVKIRRQFQDRKVGAGMSTGIKGNFLRERCTLNQGHGYGA
ncbi:MAG: hypothetical protein JWM21_3547 [Acidobacteria bacterium]|nr:hypothetical protein [Acidobacteriota bacterium]